MFSKYASAEDNEEIAVKRYKNYENSIEPVINYNKKSNFIAIFRI